MDLSIQYPWFRRSFGPFYPSRLLDQFFGDGLFDYDLFPFSSSTTSPYYRQSMFRNFMDSGLSEVRSDKDRFLISLDVKHFSPDELSVKIVDDFVEIHGKHGDRQDDHGYISREFHRRYRMPSNLEQSAFVCSLSPDGILTLCCPKNQLGGDSSRQDRPIPVTREEKPTTSPSS
ncbi:alpha-crystallin A chain [Callorhinchus milii]|uniref:Alpha-crystallin A chain n=1 Tax=Callorhinchus milii TaxID=7868 RepID=A0A4W3HKN5_CALMI|nr:alpha-crystallin A chain [Callorhinchus milii]|eukprot:gi/632980375/ref/XP_007907000.1/ PREDICTED: alpha-crystallin A chain [Callorhinchus milii]